MARKTYTQAQKDASVERLLAGRTTSDEARRMGVSPQAIREWRSMYFSAHPEKRPKPVEVLPPAPPPPESPTPTPAPAGPEDGGLDAALGALGHAVAGGPEKPAPAGSPPPPHAAAVASAIEDEALVFMVGNQAMGWTTRGGFLLACSKSNLSMENWPKFDDRLSALCVLTEAEKAGLRPAAPVIAPIIRRWIGSNENVAIGVAVSVLVGGLVERFMVIRTAVREAIEVALKKKGSEL